MSITNSQAIEEGKRSQTEKHKMKQCSVNLFRMSKMQYDMYSRADEIVTKKFDIKITGNELAIVNGDKMKKQHSTNRSFRINLKRHLSELVLEVCDATPKVNTTITEIPMGKTLNSLINASWRTCKKDFAASGQCLQIQDLVLAKMRGYQPWGAQITSFSKNKKRAIVHFFGTNNGNSVDVSEITAFSHSQDVIRLLLLRKFGTFHKSILEIETILKVPAELSLLKEREKIK